MLCLSGFELYSRWVPLTLKVACYCPSHKGALGVSLPVGFCGMVIGGRGLTVVTGGLTVEGLVVVGVRVLLGGTSLVVVDSDVTVGVLVVMGARVLLGGTSLVVVDSNVTVRGLVVVGTLVFVDGTPFVVVDSDVIGGIVGFTK